MLVHAYFSVSIFKVIGAYKDLPQKVWHYVGQRIYKVALYLGKSHVRLNNCFKKKLVNMQRWILRFGC